MKGLLSFLPKKGERQYRGSLAIWIFTFTFVSLIVLPILYNVIFQSPSFEELENPKYDLASFIFDDKDRVIGKYFVENRVNVPYKEINPLLIKAAIAEEDQRFFDHDGVDYKALWRVAIKTLILGEKQSGGGSTITQQLAKLLYKRPKIDDLTSIRAKAKLVNIKLKEWVTAVKLEHTYTKEEIISLYLNKFEFINGAHGIVSASKIYFDKDQKDLLPEEIALLVGMLQNPSFYNPIRYPQKAEQRRNEVLKKMKTMSIIQPEAFDTLITKKLKLNAFKKENPIEGFAPYFRNEVTKMIRELLDDNKISKPDGTPYNVFLDGLKIYTTIDLDYQKEAENALTDHVAWLQDRYWKVWKNKDPITYKADSTIIKSRKKQFEKHLRLSDRYQLMLENYLATMPELGFEFDDDILDFLTNNKEISKSDLVKYLPKYKDKNDQILSIVKGSQWNVIKSSYLVFKDSVRVVFDKKVKMQVFDHKLGRKTVIMSPKDSVLFHLQHLQGGLLALDPKTGFVKAWVGGLDYEYFKFDHCTAYRQVGSTVKPFVYATTMESKGIKPCTYYPDMPYTITPGESKFILSQEWKPDNSTENFTYNPYNLYHGLLYSKNSITVKLMKELGDAEPLRQTLKRVGMDIDKILPNGQIAVPNVPSICLGAIDATLFDMVGAYTSFVNEGVYSKPQIIKRIEDRQGRVIYQGYSPKQKAIDPLVSSALLEMLENNCKGDFKFNFKSKVGGKTGTTNDYIDGWFLGITPGLVVGTWSGGEERFIRFTTLDDGQGYVTARPMFEKFVQRLEKNVKSFNPSANFPKKHPDLEKINNCSHRKVIYPAMERRLRQMAEDNPSMRDSIMRVLRVN